MTINQAVHFTNTEIEHGRCEDLDAYLKNRNASNPLANPAEQETADTLAERVKPGSFSCHEAMVFASTLEKHVQQMLSAHPSILTNPNYYRLAHQAATALFNLHQEIAGDHLSPVTETTEIG